MPEATLFVDCKLAGTGPFMESLPPIPQNMSMRSADLVDGTLTNSLSSEEIRTILAWL